MPVGTMDERDIERIIADLQRAQLLGPSSEWRQRTIIIGYLTYRLEMARKPVAS